MDALWTEWEPVICGQGKGLRAMACQNLRPTRGFLWSVAVFLFVFFLPTMVLWALKASLYLLKAYRRYRGYPRRRISWEQLGPV